MHRKDRHFLNISENILTWASSTDERVGPANEITYGTFDNNITLLGNGYSTIVMFWLLLVKPKINVYRTALMGIVIYRAARFTDLLAQTGRSMRRVSL